MKHYKVTGRDPQGRAVFPCGCRHTRRMKPNAKRYGT